MWYTGVCVSVYMCIQTTHTRVSEKEERSQQESTSGRREDVPLRYLEDKAWFLLQPKESLEPTVLIGVLSSFHCSEEFSCAGRSQAAKELLVSCALETLGLK